jgi:hypothetical protein
MADPAVHLPEEAIRLRSYFIWKREGCPAGKGLSHWLQAKAELEAEMNGEPPLRVPPTFVMPPVPISTPPTRRISARIGSDAASAAT